MTDRASIPPLQEQPLDEITSIEIDAERINLVFESDPALANVVQLYAEASDNAPVMSRSGSRVKIAQGGAYPGDTAAVVRLPAGPLPGLAVNLDRGNLAFEIEGVTTDIAINIGRGNAHIAGSKGRTAINIDRGNVQVNDRAGDLACNIDRGDVVLIDGEGNVAVNIDRGNASVTACRGTLNLNVERGDISILRPSEQSIRLAAGNGNVAIRQGSVRSLHVNIDRGNIVSRTQLLRSHEDDDEDVDYQDEVDTAGEQPPDIDDIVVGSLADAGISGESVRFNLGGVSIEAGETGVRIARGENEIFRASPEGVEIRGRDGKPIFAASERGVSYAGREIVSIDQRYVFNTGRGNIQIDIPDDLPARVELIVNRGRAESDIPLVEVNRPGPRGSTRRFVGVTDSSNANRVLVRASTGNGDVLIRRRPMASAADTPSADPGGTASRDARRRAVLEALSQGKISIQEAQTLIAAIERET